MYELSPVVRMESPSLDSPLETAGVNGRGADRSDLLANDVQVSTWWSQGIAAVKVLRPHQWAKNALVVLPVLLAPGLPSLHLLLSALLAAAVVAEGAAAKAEGHADHKH